MVRFLIKRFVSLIITLFAVSLVAFAIIQLPPGDFLTSYITNLAADGQDTSQALVDKLRDTYGLDQPITIQYAKWMTNIQIREGNAAAAVSFGGVLVGLAIPLAASLFASVSLLEVALWGGATVAVQLAVFRLADLALPDLPKRIARGEVAAAALLVGAKLATAIILAAAVAV